MKKISLLTLFPLILLFNACGDETTENITQVNMAMEVVSSAKNLPKCTKDNEGEQAFVKGEKSARVCIDGEWISVAGGYSCTTKELKDKSGIKIICNGDSIGVVKNGAKGDAGADGKDGKNGTNGKNGTDGKQGAKGDTGAPGVGCSVTSLTDSAVTIKCGSDSFTMSMRGSNGNGGAANTSVVDTNEVYEIENASIRGVSQKGPFVKGATVTAFELDGSKSLLQTGRTFSGTISQDDGRFNMSNVTLKSSFVRLSANGYYRNEVTGKRSASPITLNAVTDLYARNTVNVNLLTHLEFDRVAELLRKGAGTLNIKKAKKQAEREIFNAFHIDATGFGYSEDLDVFGKTEADAALLAISILLQGDRSEAELTELLTSCSIDLSSDSTWDDLSKRAEIADWAATADSSVADSASQLAKFRKNVKDWNLSDSVPDFEKFIRRFWSEELGLGVCGDDVPVGTVKWVSNKKSKKYYAKSFTDTTNKNRFICDDASRFRWRAATDIEKDTYQWKAGENGELKKGQINSNIYYIYDSSKKAWRYATTLEKDTYKRTCTKDGTLFSGNVTDSMYVCDAGKFRVANKKLEIELNRGCVSYFMNKSDTLVLHSSYTCTPDGWVYDSVNVIRDPRDKQVYKTIKIGSLYWMAENLNYKTENSYCYNDSVEYCAKYGRLYTWAAAKLACPSGWHLPSRAEWDNLFTAVGGGATAGKILKSQTGWVNDGNGTDGVGFMGLPAGYSIIGSSGNVGEITLFWSSSELDSSDAYDMFLSEKLDDANLDVSNKNYAFSVRCVQD